MKHSSLKDACASVSVACFEASDDKIDLGTMKCIAKLMKTVRLREKPQGRKHAMKAIGVGDVVLLLEEVFAYGPNEALCLGHLKEKLILSLMVDTAARPSDLHRLFRILKGDYTQIRFFTRNGNEGMDVRYFWSKEVDPYSSRSNSTNTWFSTWVTVWCTSPKEACSHCIMRYFLEVSSDPTEFATVRIDELDLEAQPLIWARFRDGKFRQSSVDHISKITSAGLQTAGLGHMSCQSIRGASTSKIAQCAPNLRSEMLKLGRWTTEETFRKSYDSEIRRVPRQDDEVESSCQQVLRWGFNPKLPRGVSREDYAREPAHWVGRAFQFGKIVKFEDGVYSVSKNRKSSSFFHWELMQAMQNE